MSVSEQVRYLILVTEDIDTAKGVLKKLNADKERAEAAILDAMLQQGLTKVGVDGYTASPRTDTYPNPKHGQAELCAALKETGLGSLVKESVNLQTLRSHVIEQQKLGQPLPAALDAEIELTHIHRVSLTKARS